MFKKIDKNSANYVFGTGILFFLLIFFLTGTQIGHDVGKRCESAQNRYGGECIDALIKQIADESSQSGKNDAIWALGQLGDRKALPLLEKYDTGEEIPDREKWGEGISQYELRKAIKLLKSGFNLSAFVWRN